jgi:hypothetical protein
LDGEFKDDVGLSRGAGGVNGRDIFGAFTGEAFGAGSLSNH